MGQELRGLRDGQLHPGRSPQRQGNVDRRKQPRRLGKPGDQRLLPVTPLPLEQLHRSRVAVPDLLRRDHQARVVSRLQMIRQRPHRLGVLGGGRLQLYAQRGRCGPIPAYQRGRPPRQVVHEPVVGNPDHRVGAGQRRHPVTPPVGPTCPDRDRRTAGTPATVRHSVAESRHQVRTRPYRRLVLVAAQRVRRDRQSGGQPGKPPVIQIRQPPQRDALARPRVPQHRYQVPRRHKLQRQLGRHAPRQHRVAGALPPGPLARQHDQRPHRRTDRHHPSRHIRGDDLLTRLRAGRQDGGQQRRLATRQAQRSGVPGRVVGAPEGDVPLGRDATARPERGLQATRQRTHQHPATSPRPDATGSA